MPDRNMTPGEMIAARVRGDADAPTEAEVASATAQAFGRYAALTGQMAPDGAVTVMCGNATVTAAVPSLDDALAGRPAEVVSASVIAPSLATKLGSLIAHLQAERLMLCKMATGAVKMPFVETARGWGYASAENGLPADCLLADPEVTAFMDTLRVRGMLPEV